MDDVDDQLFRTVLTVLIMVLYFFFWKYMEIRIRRRDVIMPGISYAPMPNRIMNMFQDTDSNLLSPIEQDKRWESYCHSYSKYQMVLRRTKFEYYVIYTTTYSGLANKLNGLVSSLLIAMVTNRGLLIDDWPSFDSYFNLPLVDHHYNSNSTMKKGSPLKIWRRCIEAKRIKKGDINIEFGEGNINVITNCPIYSSLAKNDYYYGEFVKRGLVRTAKKGDYDAIADEVYHRLLHFFTLESSLYNRFNTIRSSWNNSFVVGMQIRVGLGNSAFIDNCKFLFMDDIPTFLHYALYYSNRTDKTPIWFISTDSPDVEEFFTKRYPDRVFFNSDMPMKHSKMLAYSYKNPAVQRAILDNYLLSEADLLITTAWSSFGEMALGRMDKGSTIMITRSDPIKDPPPLFTFNHEH